MRHANHVTGHVPVDHPPGGSGRQGMSAISRTGSPMITGQCGCSMMAGCTHRQYSCRCWIPASGVLERARHITTAVPPHAPSRLLHRPGSRDLQQEHCGGAQCFTRHGSLICIPDVQLSRRRYSQLPLLHHRQGNIARGVCVLLWRLWLPELGVRHAGLRERVDGQRARFRIGLVYPGADHRLNAGPIAYRARFFEQLSKSLERGVR